MWVRRVSKGILCDDEFQNKQKLFPTFEIYYITNQKLV